MNDPTPRHFYYLTLPQSQVNWSSIQLYRLTKSSCEEIKSNKIPKPKDLLSAKEI